MAVSGRMHPKDALVLCTVSVLFMYFAIVLWTNYAIILPYWTPLFWAAAFSVPMHALKSRLLPKVHQALENDLLDTFATVLGNSIVFVFRFFLGSVITSVIVAAFKTYCYLIYMICDGRPTNNKQSTSASSSSAAAGTGKQTATFGGDLSEEYKENHPLFGASYRHTKAQQRQEGALVANFGHGDQQDHDFEELDESYQTLVNNEPDEFERPTSSPSYLNLLRAAFIYGLLQLGTPRELYQLGMETVKEIQIGTQRQLNILLVLLLVHVSYSCLGQILSAIEKAMHVQGTNKSILKRGPEILRKSIQGSLNSTLTTVVVFSSLTIVGACLTILSAGVAHDVYGILNQTHARVMHVENLALQSPGVVDTRHGWMVQVDQGLVQAYERGKEELDPILKDAFPDLGWSSTQWARRLSSCIVIDDEERPTPTTTTATTPIVKPTRKVFKMVKKTVLRAVVKEPVAAEPESNKVNNVALKEPEIQTKVKESKTETLTQKALHSAQDVLASTQDLLASAQEQVVLALHSVVPKVKDSTVITIDKDQPTTCENTPSPTELLDPSTCVPQKTLKTVVLSGEETEALVKQETTPEPETEPVAELPVPSIAEIIPAAVDQVADIYNDVQETFATLDKEAEIETQGLLENEQKTLQDEIEYEEVEEMVEEEVEEEYDQDEEEEEDEEGEPQIWTVPRIGVKPRSNFLRQHQPGRTIELEIQPWIRIDMTKVKKLASRLLGYKGLDNSTMLWGFNLFNDLLFRGILFLMALLTLTGLSISPLQRLGWIVDQALVTRRLRLGGLSNQFPGQAAVPGKSIAKSIEYSITGTFLAMFKLSVYHTIFTVIWSQFLTNQVLAKQTPQVLADFAHPVKFAWLTSLFGIVLTCFPIAPSWLVSLPGAIIHFYVYGQSPLQAFLMVLGHFLMTGIVDGAVWDTHVVKAARPGTSTAFWLGLWVFLGGMKWGPKGLLMGPVVFSALPSVWSAILELRGSRQRDEAEYEQIYEEEEENLEEEEKLTSKKLLKAGTVLKSSTTTASSSTMSSSSNRSPSPLSSPARNNNHKLKTR